MRLSKKIAAVALAAVMAVSMLTACGGTDAPSSSSPGSSSSSSSGSSSSSSTSTGSSSSTSSSSNSSSDTSSNSSSSGSENTEETITYEKSRTAKFYQRFGTSYTVNVELENTAEGEKHTAKILYSTNGNRIYEQITSPDNGKEKTRIILADRMQKKGWFVTPAEQKESKGKYCTVDLDAALQGNQSLVEVKPIEGIKFTQETNGAYYIEKQTYEQTVQQDSAKVVVTYCYEGNSIVPKYACMEYFENGKQMVMNRMEYNSVEFQANEHYMDFESILGQCVDITDQLN